MKTAQRHRTLENTCARREVPRAAARLWLCAGLAVVSPGVARADTAPPELIDFTFSPVSIDTEGADAVVQVTLVAGDDLSGVASVEAVFAAPGAGRSIRGDSVTVAARLLQGSPGRVSRSAGVRLEYRALPSGSFTPIPARDAAQPNPDTTYPYFIHWDVSGMPQGDYELRAVARDSGGVPDPAPAAITITLAAAGGDIDEHVDAQGSQESRTAVDGATGGDAAAGDRAPRGALTRVTLPGSSSNSHWRAGRARSRRGSPPLSTSITRARTRTASWTRPEYARRIWSCVVSTRRGTPTSSCLPGLSATASVRTAVTPTRPTPSSSTETFPPDPRAVSSTS
ncbi:MAG: hypothetical protein HYS34_02140 [Acidobacteria bacterium]|nr:hypothetical protein [Acidobacteriota bacterium]